MSYPPNDLIILDWYMPGMNGAQTAQKIHEIYSSAIIVIMSAADWSELKVEALECDLRHFLPKPILPSTLMIE